MIAHDKVRKEVDRTWNEQVNTADFPPPHSPLPPMGKMCEKVITFIER